MFYSNPFVAETKIAARGKYKEASSSDDEESSSGEPDLGSDEDSGAQSDSDESRSGSGSEDEEAAEAPSGSAELIPFEPESKVRAAAWLLMCDCMFIYQSIYLYSFAKVPAVEHREDHRPEGDREGQGIPRKVQGLLVHAPRVAARVVLRWRQVQQAAPSEVPQALRP